MCVCKSASGGEDKVRAQKRVRNWGPKSILSGPLWWSIEGNRFGPQSFKSSGAAHS